MPGTTQTIELRLHKIAQLFNSLDPSPFYERDLDANAEEFIIGWAQEYPHDAELALTIYLPEAELAVFNHEEAAAGIGAYFTQRADATGRQLRELFRFGRRALAGGLVALAACLFMASLLSDIVGQSVIIRFVQEGLIIFGWVANWKPAEIFLYDWWPVARRRSLLRRLAAARVTFECAEATSIAAP